MTECWYRFEDRRYADAAGDDGYASGSHVEVHLREYEVVKRTPRGAWLRLTERWPDWPEDQTAPMGDPPRFVRYPARKCFALPTVEEALASFRARKRRQASIHRARARGAEEALALAERRWGPGEMARRRDPLMELAGGAE